DIFLNLSLNNAFPDQMVGAEIELMQSSTKRQKGNLDQIKLTGRYMWQDDIAGDPISLTPGVSYIQAFRKSVKDVSSFHHGLNNIECFISIGKENPEERSWNSRWWGLLALGIAEQGSPWCRAHLNVEKRLGKTDELKFFMHSLWGFGKHKLRLN